MDSSYRTDDPHWPEGAQDQPPLILGVGGRLHSRLGAEDWLEAPVAFRQGLAHPTAPFMKPLGGGWAWAGA